jgi:sulfur carrier protein
LCFFIVKIWKESEKMKVNGTFIELEKKQTLFDFLTMQKFEMATIAVERNGEIIPNAVYKEVLLENEDNLEIVRFVGGG